LSFSVTQIAENDGSMMSCWPAEATGGGVFFPRRGGGSPAYLEGRSLLVFICGMRGGRGKGEDTTQSHIFSKFEKVIWNLIA
jgi:hypothetical protein